MATRTVTVDPDRSKEVVVLLSFALGEHDVAANDVAAGTVEVVRATDSPNEQSRARFPWWWMMVGVVLGLLVVGVVQRRHDGEEED